MKGIFISIKHRSFNTWFTSWSHHRHGLPNAVVPGYSSCVLPVLSVACSQWAPLVGITWHAHLFFTGPFPLACPDAGSLVQCFLYYRVLYLSDQILTITKTLLIKALYWRFLNDSHRWDEYPTPILNIVINFIHKVSLKSLVRQVTRCKMLTTKSSYNFNFKLGCIFCPSQSNL